jgi:hypothetical protein
MPSLRSRGNTQIIVSLHSQHCVLSDPWHASHLILTHIFFVDDSWPELLGALFQLSQALEAEKRETAYRVFATTPGIIEKQHEEAVLQAFQRGFKDDAVQVQ